MARKESVFTFQHLDDEYLEVEITEEQFQLAQRIQKMRLGDVKSVAAARKHISQHYGFAEFSARELVESFFNPTKLQHKSFDYDQQIEAQSDIFFHFYMTLASCACNESTCTQGVDSGCPIFRDPEAMNMMLKAITTHSDDGKYTLKMKIRSKDNEGLNLNTFMGAADLWYGKIPLPFQADDCGEHAACTNQCTYAAPSSTPTLAATYPTKKKKAEGVLVNTFDSLFSQLSVMLGYFENKFMPRQQTLQEPVVIIGAGPAGIAAAIAVHQRGGKAIIYDASDQFGGGAKWAVTSDKTDKRVFHYLESLFEQAGIEIHKNTIIGPIPEKQKPGKQYITFSELKEKHHGFIMGPGVLDRARKLGIAQEDNPYIVDSMDLLEPMSKYNDELKAALRAKKASVRDFDELQFIKDYMRDKPFTFEVNGMVVNPKDFHNVIIGFGDTSKDNVRMLLMILSSGDPNALEGGLNWYARRVGEEGEHQWGQHKVPLQQLPELQMLELAHELGGAVSIEFLRTLEGINEGSNREIASLTLGVREVTNPALTKYQPDAAKYRMGTTEDVIFPDNKPIMIYRAVSFEPEKPSPLLEEAKLVQDGRVVPHKDFYTKQPGIMIAGDAAGGGTVVEATQHGYVAGTLLFDFLLQAGKKEQEFEALWEKTRAQPVDRAMIITDRPGKEDAACVLKILNAALLQKGKPPINHSAIRS